MYPLTKKLPITLVPLGMGRLRIFRAEDKRAGIEKANDMLHEAGFTDLNLSTEEYKIGTKDIIPFLVGTFETRRMDELNLLLASPEFKELLPEGFLVGCACPDFNNSKITVLMADLK